MISPETRRRDEWLPPGEPETPEGRAAIIAGLVDDFVAPANVQALEKFYKGHRAYGIATPFAAAEARQSCEQRRPTRAVSRWLSSKALDYLRGLGPTPTALRNGRMVLVAVAVIVGVIAVLMVVVPGFGDVGMLTILAATMVTLAGHAIAYLGQPTLARYRVGLLVLTVGTIAAFWLLVADPFTAG